MSATLETRFRAGLGALVGGNLINRVLGMLLAVWLARYLGQQDFGKLSYVQSFLALLSVVPAFGLDRILAREMARAPERTEGILANAFLLKTLLSVPVALAAIAVVCAAPFEGDLRALLILSSVRLLAAVAQPLFAVLEANLDLVIPKLCDVLCGLLALTVASVAMLSGASFLAVGAVLLLLGRPGDAGLPTVVAGWCLARRYVRPRFGYHRETFWSLVRSAAPVALSGVLVMAAARLDQLLIAPLLGVGALGLYSVAVRVTEGSSILSAALMMTLIPLMARYAATNPGRLERSYCLCFRYLSITALGMLLVGSIAGEALLALVFGGEYAAAGPAFRILILAQLFSFWWAVIAPFLIATDRLGRVLALNALNAGSNLVLNLWLIPHWGIAGAAAATAISCGLACAALWCWRDLRPLARAMWGSCLRPAFAFLAATIPVLAWLRAGGAPFLLAGGGLVAYLGVLLLTGGLSVRELRLLLRGRAVNALEPGG